MSCSPIFGNLTCAIRIGLYCEKHNNETRDRAVSRLGGGRGSNVKVGIVEAGLASLAYRYELKKNGIFATLYKASNCTGKVSEAQRTTHRPS